MQQPFAGSALAKVDRSGACRLPAGISRIVEQRSGGQAVLIGVHPSDDCLSGYDLGTAAQLITPPGGSDDKPPKPLRRVFGTAERIDYDARRRVVIPPFLRRKAKIGSEALFVGTGASFEIWNPQLAQESADESLAEIAAWHLGSDQVQ